MGVFRQLCQEEYVKIPLNYYEKFVEESRKSVV